MPLFTPYELAETATAGQVPKVTVAEASTAEASSAALM